MKIFVRIPQVKIWIKYQFKMLIKIMILNNKILKIIKIYKTLQYLCQIHQKNNNKEII